MRILPSIPKGGVKPRFPVPIYLGYVIYTGGDPINSPVDSVENDLAVMITNASSVGGWTLIDQFGGGLSFYAHQRLITAEQAGGGTIVTANRGIVAFYHGPTSVVQKSENAQSGTGTGFTLTGFTPAANSGGGLVAFVQGTSTERNVAIAGWTKDVNDVAVNRFVTLTNYQYMSGDVAVVYDSATETAAGMLLEFLM